jgi:hypothetical protein
MKQKICCFFSALVIFSFSYSQSPSTKGYISFSVGPAFPIGDFGSDDIKKNSSGLAKLGQAANFSWSRLLGKRLGIAAVLHGQRNPLNTRSMEKQFSKTGISQGFWLVSDLGQPLPPPSYTVYPNWKFEKGSWLKGSLLIGGYGEFPFRNNIISFVAKALAGYGYVSAPAIKGSSITDTATAHLEQTKSSACGLTYLVNGGLKIDISKNISLLTQVEYVSTAELRFDDVKATLTTTRGTPGTPGFSIAQSRITGQARQTISSLNVMAGVALKL